MLDMVRNPKSRFDHVTAHLWAEAVNKYHVPRVTSVLRLSERQTYAIERKIVYGFVKAYFVGSPSCKCRKVQQVYVFARDLINSNFHIFKLIVRDKLHYK